MENLSKEDKRDRGDGMNETKGGDEMSDELKTLRNLIDARIKELGNDECLKQRLANVKINAPLALKQYSIETAISELCKIAALIDNVKNCAKCGKYTINFSYVCDECKIKIKKNKFLNRIEAFLDYGVEMMNRLENNKSLINNPHFFNTLLSRFTMSLDDIKRLKKEPWRNGQKRDNR